MIVLAIPLPWSVIALEIVTCCVQVKVPLGTVIVSPLAALTSWIDWILAADPSEW
jgi:hypothetical protein